MPRVIHFEIHAEDPARAVSFYKKVFTWDIKQWGDQEYWIITTGPDGTPGINGAIVRRRGPAPVNGAPVNGHVNTIDVVSVDTTAQLILENGGKIALDKMAVPGVGWLAYYKDTEENIFGIMQSDTAAA